MTADRSSTGPTESETMAKARALDKRRKSIRNIRKITRTMELIATARYRKAMERATAVTDFTQRITQVVADLSSTGAEARHPLLETHPTTERGLLLVLSANRGLCGGYNASIVRTAVARHRELTQGTADQPGLELTVEVSGTRGNSALRYRDITVDQLYRQFDDQPAYAEVEEIANVYIDKYVKGQIDRLDVVYTRFVSMAKQEAVAETLLPFGALAEESASESAGEVDYDFYPSAEGILAEIVPMSFRAKLFKCFLDAAVSEQIARMVAMKSATENADDMIKRLSMTYNRARQSQITNEIMEIIAGAEALAK